MTTFTIDIETIPCQLPGVLDEFRAQVQAPGQYKKPESIAEWLRENREAEAEKAWMQTSFDGGLGQICVIGAAVDDEAPVSFMAVDLSRESEAETLLRFFAWLEAYRKPGSRYIGHNIIGFDLPFLWKRAMVLGVQPPLHFPRAPKAWSEIVQDTMLLWDPTQRAGGSMDKICRALGIPGKGDMDGSKVWPAVKEGRIAEVAEYCRADVARTREMFKRMTFTERMEEPAKLEAMT